MLGPVVGTKLMHLDKSYVDYKPCEEGGGAKISSQKGLEPTFLCLVAQTNWVWQNMKLLLSDIQLWASGTNPARGFSFLPVSLSFA